MVGSRLNVHLYRDSFNTPWGFRLQGGKDLNQPLTVQRVFSNSPAEGELQRGDVILSINEKATSGLTHKQAQDYIKHAGGQVELVVNRPPVGTYVSPLSPTIVTQRPRAPSLQSPSSHYSSRPTAIPVNHYSPNPYNPTMPSSAVRHIPIQHKPSTQPLHVYATTPVSTQYHRACSQPPTTPTPTTPTPPWAAQQVAPRRVSRLSNLGGAGMSFGTDYCTLPRQSASQHHRPRPSYELYDEPQETPEVDRLATGPPPRVCSLRNLGGGGINFGSSYGSGSATLPRRNTGRRLSQPPSMPSSGVYGHMPKKLTISSIGGGGPQFGSDYSQRGGPFGQTSAQRVHTSLDNIVLSPRTPDAGSSTSPFYQTYQPQSQPQYQPVGPPSPQYTYQPAQPQPPPPQQMYTPTGLLLEQQRLQEQQQQNEVRTPMHKPAPKVPKPRPVPTSRPSFGTDYTAAPQPRHVSSTTFHPAPFSPVSPSANPPGATYSPAGVSYGPKPQARPAPHPVHSQEPIKYSAPTWQRPPQVEDDGVPAWRSTLRSSGSVKPWEMDVEFSQQQSEPYNPAPANTGGQAVSSAPFNPSQGGGGGTDNGPKVVHLQYNSPMHLYSNENVAETYKGQTQALAGSPTKPPPPGATQPGGRDWSQSAVLQLISQRDNRGKPKPPPPAVSPKPQVHQPQQQYSPAPQQQLQQPYMDEIGTSDF